MNIVCFSDITWNFLWQRQQQIISHFPEDWEILYIEPAWWLSFVWGIINKQINSVIPHNVKHNVKVLSVPAIPFVDRFEKFRRINDQIITWWVKTYLKIYNMSEPVFMFYKPRYACILDKLNPKLIYYDITDDTLKFDDTPMWLKNYYDKIIKKSGLITVTSRTLYDKLSKLSDNVFLVGNGVDYEHYTRSLRSTKPTELTDIQSVKIGYIGAIGGWFDFILLEKILKRYSNMTVILIGWIFRKYRKRINELKAEYPNLRILGRKKFEDLPDYVNSFDIGIIPFKINELTLSVNPNKLYEYMACGKPVVSVILPEIEKYNKNICLAKNHDEFLEQIKTVLTTKVNKEELQEIAKNNSWNYRVIKIIELIKNQSKT